MVTALVGALGTPVAAQASPANGAPGVSVSVVVEAEPGMEAAAAAAVDALGGRVDQPLAIINGFSATLGQNRVGELENSSAVLSVTSNGSVQLLGSSYDPSHDNYSAYNLQDEMGSRTLWNHDTGAGVGVALIDSGVTPVQGLNNPGQVVNGPDLTEESQSPTTDHLDTYGHGTFMAGIIAGDDPGVNPAKSQGNQQAYMGVAPSATIVSVKVADATGTTDVSQVIAGIDWVVQNAHDPGLNIRVINLSFGTNSTQSYLVDPLAFACEVAWRDGIVVVASAGNNGTTGGLNMPAADPFVIAVGAVDTNGHPGPAGAIIPSFSAQGNGTRNPDIVAPGDHVEGLRDPGSYIDSNYGSTGQLSSRFFRGSGTSEAAAFVSGSVAELLQKNSGLTPDQVKGVLMQTAQPIGGVSPTLQGAGIINMRAASGPISGPGPVAPMTQTSTPSNGSGSLEASRGTDGPSVGGTTLSANEDIFGDTFDSSAMAAAESAGTAWQGGTWNAATWAGASWTNPTEWGDAGWTGTDWLGNSWSSWSATGASWSSAGWSGHTWSGHTWSGHTWSGSTWSTASWS